MDSAVISPYTRSVTGDGPATSEGVQPQASHRTPKRLR